MTTRCGKSISAVNSKDASGWSHSDRAKMIALGLACVVVWLNPVVTRGQSWSSYPPPGVNNTVRCAIMYTPSAGPLIGQSLLIVGGDFTAAGNVTVSCIAAWNGTTWSDMNGGMTGAIGSGLGVDSLTVWDPDGAGANPPLLIAGGRFTTAGGGAARDIAQWDGSAWSSVGGAATSASGNGGDVEGLGVWDSDGAGPQNPILVAGGFFTGGTWTGGSMPARVAQWNGTTWSSMGTVSGGGLRCFVSDTANNFYAGGSGTAVAGQIRIARWDAGTSTWVALGTGLTGSGTRNVRALTAFGANIVAGGDFTGAGGVASTASIALWNGSGWVSLGGNAGGQVRSLASFAFGADPAKLIAGGDFTTMAGGTVTGANRIAQWDGINWAAMGAGVGTLGTDTAQALAVYNSTNLIVGGIFTSAGGVTANRIATWGDIVVPVCATTVTPTTTPLTATADPGTTPNPDHFDYVLTNTSSAGSINYTVTKIPNDASTAWCVVSPASGGPIGVGGQVTITATLSTTSPTLLAPGVYSVILRFADSCNPNNSTDRTITLTIPRWRVTPLEPAIIAPHVAITDASIVSYLNCLNPQTYAYTIKNLGPDPLSYTVAETDDTGAPNASGWLQINDTGNGGPLSQNQTAIVNVTLTGTGDGTEALGVGVNGKPDSLVDTVRYAYLKFTSTGFGDVEMREIQQTERYLGGMFGYVRSYFGNVMPNVTDWDPNDPLHSVGSCGPGCNFNLIGGSATGSIVTDNSDVDPDYNAEDGLALKISQGAGGNPIGKLGYATDVNGGTSGGGNNNSFNTRLGETMVARIKVVRDTDMVANMWIRDNHNGTGGGADREPFAAGCRVQWNANNQISESVNSAGPFSIGSKPNAYHLIRVVDGWGPYGEHVVKVWVDEAQNPNPALEVHGAQAENETQYNAFCFGTFGSNSDSEVYYDWVSFTNAGMYGPGQEISCLGTSLLPPGACCNQGACTDVQPDACTGPHAVFKGRGTTCATTNCCADPFADADFDGDVDVDDFGKWQLCYTGDSFVGVLPPECRCFDRNGDNKITTIPDYDRFQNCSSGSGVPASPACDD